MAPGGSAQARRTRGAVPLPCPVRCADPRALGLTPLDAAHAAMEASDAARLRFYERLADAELFLLLAREAEGEAVEPELFALEDGPVALAFDREARLAEFTGAPAPYAALSGRTAAALLRGRGIGLGVNLGVAPSSILMPPEAVDWLAATLEHAPAEALAKAREVRPPGGLPPALLEALDAKMPAAAGLARTAYLAGVTYEDGRRSHLLAFVDARPGAEDALARAASEALTFSGLEMGEMDVAFLRPSDPLAARLARVALRLDLPRPPPPRAPGTDPGRPPKLR